MARGFVSARRTLWTGMAAVLLATLIAGGAQAQRAAPPPRAPGGVVACDFSGWSVDRGNFGLPVRYEPRADAAVLARLPPPRVVGVDEVAVLVRVTGYTPGWFRIGSAYFPAEADDAFARQSATWFRGDGWVPVDSIKSTLAADTLRAAPKPNAKVVASLRGARGGFPITPDGVAVRRLLACQGQWVQADTEFGIGWVARVCARQLEQC